MCFYFKFSEFKRNEDVGLDINFYVNVCSSFVYYFLKLVSLNVFQLVNRYKMKVLWDIVQY